MKKINIKRNLNGLKKLAKLNRIKIHQVEDDYFNYFAEAGYCYRR